jgi:hypothetical protein
VLRLLRITVGLAIVAAPAVALASGGSRQVWVTNCIKEQYKPGTVFIACGDGSDYLTKLSWSSWSATQASGKGTDEVNLCDPDCVSGHFKSYAVTVALSQPTSCHKRKHKVFNLLKLTYTGSHPKGFKQHEMVSLGCPFPS